MADASARRPTTRTPLLYVLFTVSQYTPLYWPYMWHLVTEVHGLSGAEFGWLKALYYATVVLLEVPLGLVADRFGRKATLVFGALSGSAGCALYGLATEFWLFAAAEIALGCAAAAGSGAASALLFESLQSLGRGSDYAQVEGRARMLSFAAFTLGLPLADAFLVPGGDPSPAYFATASISLVGVGASLAMSEPGWVRSTDSPFAVGAPLRQVAGSFAVARVLILGAATFVLTRAANGILFDPVLASAGVPVDRFGIFMASVAALGAVGASQAHRLSRLRGDRPLVVLWLAMSTLYGALLVAAGGVRATLLCLHGLASGLHPVIVSTLLNERIDLGAPRATILSLESVVNRSVYGVAVLAIGAALDSSLSWALLTTSLLAILLPVVGILVARQVRTP